MTAVSVFPLRRLTFSVRFFIFTLRTFRRSLIFFYTRAGASLFSIRFRCERSAAEDNISVIEYRRLTRRNGSLCVVKNNADGVFALRCDGRPLLGVAVTNLNLAAKALFGTFTAYPVDLLRIRTVGEL